MFLKTKMYPLRPLSLVSSRTTFLMTNIFDPDTVKLVGIDDLLSYFQTTWIQGLTTSSGTGQAKYPPLTWNAYDRTHFHMNRTNNFVESWSKKFSLTLGHSNPTIYNFISALQLEQSSTDGKILAYNVGEMPPRGKRRNVEKDRRIHTVVENYDAYEGNVIAYLDLLNSVC